VTAILILLAGAIGTYIGREWAEIRYQRRLMDAQRESQSWREICQRQQEARYARETNLQFRCEKNREMDRTE
jgi:hypothetical protein